MQSAKTVGNYKDMGQPFNKLTATDKTKEAFTK